MGIIFFSVLLFSCTFIVMWVGVLLLILVSWISFLSEKSSWSYSLYRMELRLDGLLTYPIDLLDLVLKDCSSYKTVLVGERTSLSLYVIYQCWGCSLIQTHSIESHNRYNQYFIMICCYLLGERSPLFVLILTLLSLDLVGTDTILNEIIDLIHSILHFSAVVWHLELLKS